MRYIQLVIEICKLVGYTKSTVDQATKVYRLLAFILEALQEADAGPEL